MVRQPGTPDSIRKADQILDHRVTDTLSGRTRASATAVADDWTTDPDESSVAPVHASFRTNLFRWPRPASPLQSSGRVVPARIARVSPVRGLGGLVAGAESINVHAVSDRRS
eukprot:9038537-Pyramimonas_sp.AAC.1